MIARNTGRPSTFVALGAVLFVSACGKDEPKETGAPTETAPPTSETESESESAYVWDCVLEAKPVPDFGLQVGCRDDFDLLAADPLDASIPGAQSSKTVVDRIDGDALYFTNSELYPIHYDFASQFLSGDGLPIVADLGTFNATEYYSPDRRFVLGAITWYEEPGVFVYEIAPYDTASADLITLAYDKIVENAYFGDELYFHPTSEAVELVALDLPDHVKQISTEELFAGITYQPLNLGSSMGQLTFRTTEEIENYVNYREIVVLDGVPNDISVVAGTITAEFQTPLAHINVLAQNRGTPNMALLGAFDDPTLRALEGRWVELTVDALEWTIREVTEGEADAWWKSHAPDPLEVIPMDTSVEGLWSCEVVVDPALSLGSEITRNVPIFGGKGTHMAAMVHLGDEVTTPPCFLTPMHYYDQHMTQNGLWDRYATLTMDPGWGDPIQRAELLEGFQDEIRDAPIDPDFLALVMDKIDAEYDRIDMRFRSSTNAEDLGDFTGAGLYESKTGSWDSDGDDISDAIRDVWASLWGPRAWEEREYWGIEHTLIGMAMLSNPQYEGEDANGVAVTGNIYDLSGVEPAFYINAQKGEASVVIPDEGDTTDQILYYYNLPGRPIVYIAHSNLVAEGETVLTEPQLYDLGIALDAIHNYFYPVYGTAGGFYAMDTEWKLVDGLIEMKQARPYPGWSADE